MASDPKTAEEIARAALVHAHNEGRNLTSQEVFDLVESAMQAGKAEAWDEGVRWGGCVPIDEDNPYTEPEASNG